MIEGIRSLLLLGRFSSQQYWMDRYQRGGDSGSGSYGELAKYKAKFINDFVVEHGVASAIEFGCGDGAQAAGFRIPRYTGVDISSEAIELCQHSLGDRPEWRFFVAENTKAYSGQYDLALSLDVIYHLVEDATYDAYMERLFSHAQDHVLIYASDAEKSTITPHVRHRKHSKWVSQHRPGWRLLSSFENPLLGHGKKRTFAYFTHYGRVDT